MKTLLKLLSVFACICVLVSCDLQWGWLDYPPQCQDAVDFGPFQVDAYFNTTFSKNVIPEGHIDLKGTVSQLEQTGSGTDKEIGFFQISLVCCWSLDDCTVGRSGGTITDSYGNTLNIVCKEDLTANDLKGNFPSDQTHITGRFEFAGGTGRFADASGEGTIDCIVSAEGNVSSMSHHWTGIIKNVIGE